MYSILTYACFYSVTLSYNLFFEEEDDTSALTVDTMQERAVQRIVSALRLPGNFGDSRPFVAFHLQSRYVGSLHWLSRILMSQRIYLFSP